MKKTLLAAAMSVLSFSDAFATEAWFKVEALDDASADSVIQAYSGHLGTFHGSFAKHSPDHPFGQFVKIAVEDFMRAPQSYFRCATGQSVGNASEWFTVEKDAHYIISVKYNPNAYPNAGTPQHKAACEITYQKITDDV